MGFENRFAASLDESGDGTADHGRLAVNVGGAHWRVEALPGRLPENGAVDVYFRPESASLGTADAPNSMPGAVTLRTYRGSTLEYLVRTDVGEFIVYDDDPTRYEVGDNVYLVVPPHKLVALPASP